MQHLAHEVYRQMLLKKRALILSALRLDRGQGSERVAEEDQGTVAHEEFVSMRLNHMDYHQLRLINEALDRIGSGDYGVCLACEEPENAILRLGKGEDKRYHPRKARGLVFRHPAEGS